MLKLLLFIFIFSLYSSTLYAYSKKILIASYTDKQSAQLNLGKITNSLSKNRRIQKLQASGIDFTIENTGKYYVVTMKSFNNISDLYKALRIIKKEYKSAYYSDNDVTRLSEHRVNTHEYKVKVLSQKSMQRYLEEMKKYKQSLEEQDEVVSSTFDMKKKELQLPEITLNTFLIFITFFSLIYYITKFILQHKDNS